MNRAQRRLQQKINRTVELTERQQAINERLHSYYQKQVNELVDKYNKELLELEDELQKERENNIENDWYWFYANLCLTLKEDYHKNNDYIANFVTKVEHRLKTFKDSGLKRDDLIKICQEKCDVVLCSDIDEEVRKASNE